MNKVFLLILIFLIISLANIYFKKVEQLNEINSEILRKKRVIEIKRRKIKKLQELMKFSEDKWKRFLSDVNLLILKNNLNILEQNNTLIKTKRFDKKAELEMLLSGEFIDFIKFLYGCENRVDLINIEKIEANLSNNRYFVRIVEYGN